MYRKLARNTSLLCAVVLGHYVYKESGPDKQTYMLSDEKVSATLLELPDSPF